MHAMVECCPSQAVDKNTLIQLRGNAAKGYAFDRCYGPEHTSDSIYEDCVTHLVENLFKVSTAVHEICNLPAGQKPLQDNLSTAGASTLHVQHGKAGLLHCSRQPIPTQHKRKTMCSP